MHKTRLVVAAAALAAGGTAYGKSVRIDGLGGAIALQSKDISSIVFGPGATPPKFTNEALAALHADIASSGVNTNDMVSIVFAKTSHGFTLLTLVDDQQHNVTFNQTTATLGFNSTVQRSDAMGPNQWINDAGGDIGVSLDFAGNFQTGLGTFNWDAASGFGDAFAWSDLQTGDFISNTFTEQVGALGFQFLSWEGGAWTVIDTAEFSAGGSFAYSAQVIPLPTGGALGVVGLASLAAVRRRRLCL